MTGTKRLMLIVLCVGFSYFLFLVFPHGPGHKLHTVDLAEIYFGDRCALQHKDPYDPATVLNEFFSEGGQFPAEVAGKPPSDSRVAKIVLSNAVNLPTSFFLFLPFALLPWSVASYLWVGISGLLLAIAAWLTWDLGACKAPAVWAWLAGFMLANCQQIFATGNIAAVAVGLCIIAAWCFLRQRFAGAAIVLLAFSLLLKPHDAGFVWLYFLLAGGTLRKRALQTLAVTAVLGLCTAAWIARISPHWSAELHRNISSEVARGGIDDPGPSGERQNTTAPVIDLQDVISLFKDDAGLYNMASYAIFGVLILLWAVVVLRKRGAPHDAPFALAAVAALTMLPVYHRPYDAKLLLLALPACAMLWAAKARKRTFALALTSVTVILTSDIPLAIQVAIGKALTLSADTLGGKLATMLILRPAPLVLLALGCFYLWIYIRYEPTPSPSTHAVESAATR
jgi:hypothetical protein